MRARFPSRPQAERKLQTLDSAKDLNDLRVPPAFGSTIHVPATRVNDIVNAKRGVTADTALLLARYFGNSPEFWLNLQAAYDLRTAEHALHPAAFRKNRSTATKKPGRGRALLHSRNRRFRAGACTLTLLLEGKAFPAAASFRASLPAFPLGSSPVSYAAPSEVCATSLAPLRRLRTQQHPFGHSRTEPCYSRHLGSNGSSSCGGSGDARRDIGDTTRPRPPYPDASRFMASVRLPRAVRSSPMN